MIIRMMMRTALDTAIAVPIRLTVLRVSARKKSLTIIPHGYASQNAASIGRIAVGLFGNCSKSIHIRTIILQQRDSDMQLDDNSPRFAGAN